MVRSLAGKHPLYYEAILQLREVSDKIVYFVEDEIFSYKIPVCKKAKVKNGYDYYLADNNFTKALGKRLQQKFGGEVVVTASLHTKKDGKDLFRVTVLFRGVDFKKGDEVEYNGDKYVVKGMTKEILLQAVKDGKKVHVKYKEKSRIKSF